MKRREGMKTTVRAPEGEFGPAFGEQIRPSKQFGPAHSSPPISFIPSSPSEHSRPRRLYLIEISDNHIQDPTIQAFVAYSLGGNNA